MISIWGSAAFWLMEPAPCWLIINTVLSPRPATRQWMSLCFTGETLWKTWLLLVKQNSLQSKKKKKKNPWQRSAHFLAHERWWIWRILADIPRDIWRISHAPRHGLLHCIAYFACFVQAVQRCQLAVAVELNKSLMSLTFISSQNNRCFKIPHSSGEIRGLDLRVKKPDP